MIIISGCIYLFYLIIYFLEIYYRLLIFLFFIKDLLFSVNKKVGWYLSLLKESNQHFHSCSGEENTLL